MEPMRRKGGAGVSFGRFSPPLAIGVALSALLVIGVLTFAGPCVHDDGSQATCFAASQAVLGSGIAAFVALAAGIASRGVARGVLCLVGSLAGAFAAASPGVVFPLCMIQTMRCCTVMRPFAMVVGACICLCCIVAAIGAFRAKAGRSS